MPLLFTVGTGAVNPGLEKMIFSMKPGMVRRVVVPASYVVPLPLPPPPLPVAAAPTPNI